jgi:hypothetical protein
MLQRKNLEQGYPAAFGRDGTKRFSPLSGLQLFDTSIGEQAAGK